MTNFAKIVSAPVLAALLGTATIATAETAVSFNENGERVASIQIDDISLGNPQDMAVLDQRIADAALAVCARPLQDNTLSAKSTERHCMTQASAQARVIVLARLESRDGSERVAVR